MPDALQHYGVDWIAMVLTFLAIWRLGDKRRSGFILMILGNACWVALAIRVESVAMVVANMAFLSLNLRGLIKWTAAPGA